MRVALDEALGVAMARKAEIATLRRGGLPGAIAGPAALPPVASPRVRAVQFAPVVRAALPLARRRPPRGRPQAAEPVSAEAAVLEGVFLAWCKDARPVVSQVRFFAEAVRRALPGATVDAVYRDANSQASPVMLSAQGGASPVEYWRVGRRWAALARATAARPSAVPRAQPVPLRHGHACYADAPEPGLPPVQRRRLYPCPPRDRLRGRVALGAPCSKANALPRERPAGLGRADDAGHAPSG